jgi:hypothetical protein
MVAPHCGRYGNACRHAVIHRIAMIFNSILWPLLAQIAWTFALYAWLTYARTKAVRRGEAAYDCFVLGRDEPLHVARITRNLANQFELPVIFYALALLLVALGWARTMDVVAAWAFVAGRVVHTLVQTQTDNVVLRGRVFLISFIAVGVLAVHVAWLGVVAMR